MKRIISNVMLVAAAATAFFSCQKQEVIAPETSQEVMFTFSSEKPEFNNETKTEWTGETIQWSKGDKIRVAYTCNGVWQNADGNATSDETEGNKSAKLYASTELESATEIATFKVPTTFKVNEDNENAVHEFYALYPSNLTTSTSLNFAPSVTVSLPANQTPSATSFDASADMMIAKSNSYTGIPTEAIPLKWNRLVAHGYLTLKALAVDGSEKVESIVLTANAEADMVGKYYVDFETQVVTKSGETATNVITIDGTNLSIDADGNVSFWVSFLPCTWTSLKVEVETNKASYTREINLSANQKTFAKNARNILAVNMATAVREVKSSNALPFVKDFSDKTGTNGITELDGFTVSGSVYNAAGAIRLAKGDAGGSITTQSLDLSCDFHVKVTASGWDSDELSLIVSSGDQSETVTLSAVGNGNSGPGECAEHIINFQPLSNSSSVTFAAAESKRCYIKKIEILEGHAVVAPVLNATTPNKIAAEGGEGSFTFTLANPKEGENVTAVSSVDWITNVVVSDGQVTYTVAENTSEEPREGTITLSYEGAESVDVTITQAAKPAEDVDGTPAFVKVTSAPSDWSGTYLIVFESLNKCWDGSLKGGTSSGQFGHTAGAKSITIANNTIEKNDSYFTIVKSGTNYTITSASGDCIGNSGTSAGLKTGSYTCTITLNNDNTVNILASDGNTQVLYNKSANYIRFYKTSNVTSSSYGMPSLYKLENVNDGGETPEPDPTPDPEEPEQPGQGGGGEPTTVTMTSFSATSASMDNNVSYTTAKGGGTSAPAVNSNQIRLYQNSAGTGGGTITITAKDGYKLSSVTIGSSMATKVAYTIGASTTKSTSASVSANGKYTVDDINATSITFYCMGTSSSSRLYVNYLSATYVAD